MSAPGASASVKGSHDLVDRLATDPGTWDRDTRVETLGELQQHRGWLDAREAALLAVCHGERDDVNTGARDLTQLIKQRCGVGFGDAKRRALRAVWLPELPAAFPALASGTLGTAQADELIALAERLAESGNLAALADAEAGLVAELAELTPVQARKRLAQFEADLLDEDDKKKRVQRQRRANNLRLPKNSDGTTGIHGQLDPVSGAELRAAIDAKVTEIWHREQRGRADTTAPDTVLTNERRRAQALMELIRAGAAGEPGSPGAQILVLIDYETLLGQLNTAGVTCELGDGTPIPADTARQLACDANLLPIVLGSPSQVLDVGRAARMATGPQRAALRAVHSTCCIEGCDSPFDHCEIHHTHWWRNGGTTNLDNLAPVCSRHHHLIHDYGWTLTLDQNRVGTLHKPAPTECGPHGPPNDTSAGRPECNEEWPSTTPPAKASAGDLDLDRTPAPQDAPIPMRC